MKTNVLAKLPILTMAAGLVLGVGAPFAAAQTDTDTQTSADAQTTTDTQTGADRQVDLSAGTVIPVTLRTELSSNGSTTGDRFTADVDTSRQAYSSILSGASVDGVVSKATPRDGTNPGTLTLSFTRLRLADGRSFGISGGPASLDAKDLTQREDGVLVAKKSAKNNTLTYAGIGAGAGLLLDVLRGSKLRIEDILIGGGLGAAAAQVLKGQPEVHDVDLKAGTTMGVLLNSGTRYYYRRGAGGDAGGAYRPVMPAAPRRGSGVTVDVNGSPVDFLGQGPIESDGRVLVPLRGVLEKMGADVRYDSARREVHAVRRQSEITLPIGASRATVDGRSVPLDTPARIVNGSTMVPLRFVAEALGARVNYAADTSTVAIETGAGADR